MKTGFCSRASFLLRNFRGKEAVACLVLPALRGGAQVMAPAVSLGRRVVASSVLDVPV